MIDTFHTFQCFPYIFHELGKNQKTNLVCLFPKRSDIIINKNNIYIYIPRMEKRDTHHTFHGFIVSLSHFFKNVENWKILPIFTTVDHSFHNGKHLENIMKTWFGV